MGLKFSKRELDDSAAEEASRMYAGEHISGETFRQKDWKTYHILNLVLYDMAWPNIYLSGQKTGRTTYAHDLGA